MSFKPGVAIPNFPIGRLVDKVTGEEITTGTVTGTFLLDGVAAVLSGTITYDAVAKVWVIDEITAGEINGVIGSYQFSHDDAVGGGISIPIKTLAHAQVLLADIYVAPDEPEILIPAPPADVSMCMVYGYCESLTNLPAANISLRFELQTDNAVKSNKIISERVVTVLTNSTGYFEVQLQRTDTLSEETTWSVYSEALRLEKSFSLEGPLFDIATLIP